MGLPPFKCYVEWFNSEVIQSRLIKYLIIINNNLTKINVFVHTFHVAIGI